MSLGNSLYETNKVFEAVRLAQERFINQCNAEEIFEGLLDAFLKLTKSSSGCVGRINLQPVTLANSDACEITQAGSEICTETLCTTVMNRAEVLIVNDVGIVSDVLGNGISGVTSFLGIPIYVDDKLVGCVCLANTHDAYDRSLIETLQPLLNTCGQLTVAVSRKSEQGDGYRMSHFLERYISVTSGLYLNDVIQTTLKFLNTELDIVSCSVAVREPGSTGLHVYAAHCKDISQMDGKDFQPDHTYFHPEIVEVVIGKKPYYRSNIGSLKCDSALLKRGVRSDFSVPLWIGDKCLGMLCVESGQFNGFSDQERRVIPLLAPTLAQSLENANLFESLCQREDALQSSERIWHSIAKYSPDNIILLSTDLTIKYVNYTFPDVDENQIIGRSVLDYYPQASRQLASSCYQRVLSTGKQDRFEVEYIFDGCSLFYEANIGPMKDGDKVVGLIVNARDITKRKQIEDRLHQSAVVVENTAEAVIITDTENKIISVNSAFIEITGYAEEEVLGKTPTILKSERHEREFYSRMWRSLLETGRWQGEIWDRRKNGEVFPAWQTISAVYDSAGVKSNYVSVFSDISSIKKSQEEVDFLAYHDPLTNLPNRLLFNDRLEHALQRAKRERQMVAVIFLDLDRFKYINDSFGHPVGDKLIQEAAHRLESSVRKEDTVARLGGDEFVIAMEDIQDVQDVIVLIQKLMQVFRETFYIDAHEMHVTLSMGVSIYPRDGQDSASLIKYADTAMYRAKEEGRDKYHFYTSELTATIFEQVTMENALRHALEENELTLHYQPQYSLKTKQLVGVEALVRWRQGDGGLAYPSKFITLAEQSGLIISLGEWVLRTACQQVQRWREVGIDVPCVAVNVSALQLQRQEFVETVESVLAETGLPPNCLELEITESVIMRKADWVISRLDQLKALGVTLAIDDFGTGYSSLSYLKRMPVNRLKIDKSFVRDIPHDANDEAIARSVIALGHSLKLTVIAEGVETEAQYSFLSTQGCDECQGKLYGLAMTEEELIQALHCESEMKASDAINEAGRFV